MDLNKLVDTIKSQLPRDQSLGEYSEALDAAFRLTDPTHLAKQQSGGGRKQCKVKKQPNKRMRKS